MGSVSNSTIITEDQEACSQNTTAMQLSGFTDILKPKTGLAPMKWTSTFTINGRGETMQNAMNIADDKDMNDGDTVTCTDRCVEVPIEGPDQYLEASTTGILMRVLTIEVGKSSKQY